MNYKILVPIIALSGIVAFALWRGSSSRVIRLRLVSIGPADLASPLTNRYLVIVPRSSWLDAIARPCAQARDDAAAAYRDLVRAGRVTESGIDSTLRVFVGGLVNKSAAAVSALRSLRTDSATISPAGFVEPFRLRHNQIALLVWDSEPVAYIPIPDGAGEQTVRSDQLQEDLCSGLTLAQPQ